jgi:hypothetical protein
LAKSAVNGLIPALKSLKTVSGALKFASLIGAAYLIYENWSLITETFNNFINSDFGQKIVAIWNGIVAQVTSTYETWVQILNHPVTENWINKFKGWMSGVGNILDKVWQGLKVLWDITAGLGTFLLDIGEKIAFVFNAAIDACNNSKGKFEALSKFFTTIWEPVKVHWSGFIEEIKQLDIAKEIMASWERLKTFFTTIWDDVAPKWDNFINPISKLWDNVKTKFPSVGKLLSPFTSEELGAPVHKSPLVPAPGEKETFFASKLPPLNGAKAASVTKNQSNVFNINVNASKISDPREIAKKVSEEMKNFNWNYLYDPVGELL